MSFKTTKLIRIFSLILFLVALGTSFQAKAQGTLASQLLEIAHDSLDVQYRTLVNGDIEEALRGKSRAGMYRAAIKNQLNAQVVLRNRLIKTKQDFKGYRTKLLFEALSVRGDKATLKATEITELDMSAPGGPTLAKTSDPHVFEFVKQNGEWRLLNDVVPLPKAEQQERLELPEGPALPAGATEQPDNKLSRSHHAVLSRAWNNVMPVNYNSQAAIDYARTWASGFNPAYKQFPTDCTNFVSQSLQAGGWTNVYGYYTNDSSWWYNCTVLSIKCNCSYTWGAAWNFKEFIHSAPGYPRVGFLPDFNTAWPGDILFADWNDLNNNPVPDGRVDHVMIVTGRDTEGNLYICQHTPSRQDYPFAATQQAKPQAIFYSFKVKESY